MAALLHVGGHLVRQLGLHALSQQHLAPGQVALAVDEIPERHKSHTQKTKIQSLVRGANI